MRFSTRANYGLRLCFLIGIADGVISLSTLSKQTGLSMKYLEQLLGMLRKGGVVTATRGASGGYILSRSADEITMKDIFVAVGDNFEVECVSGECSDDYCPNRRMLTRLYNETDKLFASITLKDMIDDYKCY